MPWNEAQLRAEDEQFPELARQAVADAVERARVSGRPFVVRIGDEAVEVLPDGRRRVVMPLPPMVKVERGSHIRLT